MSLTVQNIQATAHQLLERMKPEDFSTFDNLLSSLSPDDVQTQFHHLFLPLYCLLKCTKTPTTLTHICTSLNTLLLRVEKLPSNQRPSSLSPKVLAQILECTSEALFKIQHSQLPMSDNVDLTVSSIGQNTEESMIMSVIPLFQTIRKVTPSSDISQLYSGERLQTLGHVVYAVLQCCQRSRTNRALLNAACMCLRVWCEPVDCGEEEQQSTHGDMVAMLLPALTRHCVDLLLADDKLGERVKMNALFLWSQALQSVFHEAPESRKCAETTVRNQAWCQEALAQVSSQLALVVDAYLFKEERHLVDIHWMQMCRDLLAHSPQVIRATWLQWLRILTSLSLSSFEEVHTEGSKAMHGLQTLVSSVELDSGWQLIVQDTITKPRSLTVLNDEQQRRRMQVTTRCLVHIKTKEMRVTDSWREIMSVVWAELRLLCRLDPSSVHFDTETTNDSKWEPVADNLCKDELFVKRFHLIQRQETLAAMKELLAQSILSKETWLEFLTFGEQHKWDNECLLLLVAASRGVILLNDKEFAGDVAMYLLQLVLTSDKLSLDLNTMPDTNINADNKDKTGKHRPKLLPSLAMVKCQVYRVCLQLEVILAACELVHASSDTSRHELLLMQALYPVLLTTKRMPLLLAHSASLCLQRMVTLFHYENVATMLLQNSDYLRNSHSLLAVDAFVDKCHMLGLLFASRFIDHSLVVMIGQTLSEVDRHPSKVHLSAIVHLMQTVLKSQVPPSFAKGLLHEDFDFHSLLSIENESTATDHLPLAVRQAFVLLVDEMIVRSVYLISLHMEKAFNYLRVMRDAILVLVHYRENILPGVNAVWQWVVNFLSDSHNSVAGMAFECVLVIGYLAGTFIKSRVREGFTRNLLQAIVNKTEHIVQNTKGHKYDLHHLLHTPLARFLVKTGFSSIELEPFVQWYVTLLHRSVPPEISKMSLDSLLVIGAHDVAMVLYTAYYLCHGGRSKYDKFSWMRTNGKQTRIGQQHLTAVAGTQIACDHVSCPFKENVLVLQNKLNVLYHVS